jgi:hypothetical protein
MFHQNPLTSVEYLILSQVIAVVAFWRIFSKAGYPGWISVGMLLPVLNLLLMLYAAFSQWPVMRRASITRAPADRDQPDHPA